MKAIRRMCVVLASLLVLCINVQEGNNVLSINPYPKDVYLRKSISINGVMLIKNCPLVQIVSVGGYAFVDSEYGGKWVSTESLVRNQEEGLSAELVLDRSTFSDNAYDSARVVWNLIPTNVQKRVVEKGWKIKVSETDLSKLSKSGEPKVSGLTVFSDKEMLLSGKSGSIYCSLLHEVGHVVDRGFSKKYRSSSQEFKEIYKREGINAELLNCNEDYCKSNCKEYFAECFSQMLLYEDYFKEKQPDTYNYIKRIIDNL